MNSPSGASGDWGFQPGATLRSLAGSRSTYRALPKQLSVGAQQVKNFDDQGPLKCFSPNSGVWSESYRLLTRRFWPRICLQVMHHSVPEDFKPALFEHGKQIPFPRPSKASFPTAVFGWCLGIFFLCCEWFDLVYSNRPVVERLFDPFWAWRYEFAL